MLHALIDDRPDMAVCQGVKYGLSFPAVFHQFALLQSAQLVGNCGLRHIQQLGNVADTHLRFKQHIQDFNAGGIAKNLKQFG